MEKVCEFCVSLRPVVFCKADEAYLCLSCDSKVHLANALSGRHLRSLLCDSCICHLAYIQCLDHKMLLCRGCDLKLHDLSVRHLKRTIASYMGCPSAKDFATLWGFEFSEIENVSTDSDLVHVSEKPVFQKGAPSFVSKGKFEGGTSSQQDQILYRDQKRKATLQQIIDLRRLQLSEKSNHSLKINEQQETDLSSSVSHVLKKFDENVDRQAQNSQAFSIRLPQKDSYIEELKPETLSSTLSQLDNLTSSPIIDLPLDGELFWTCKSPIQSNQDALAAASVTISKSALEDRHKNLASISFSISGSSADSSVIDHYDNAVSPSTEGKGNSSSSLELEGSYVEARRNDTMKYKEKKKSQLHEKQVRLPSTKASAKVRKRVKG